MSTSIGDALRYMRRSRGLSIEQAAQLSGLRKDAIFRYESGISTYPNVTVLARLAATYNVSLDYLLSLTKPATSLFLKKALIDPSVIVYWDDTGRPLSAEQRHMIIRVLETWFSLSSEMESLLPPDEQQLLTEYRRHRDLLADKPDLDLLALLYTLMARHKEHPPEPSGTGETSAEIPQTPKRKRGRPRKHPFFPGPAMPGQKPPPKKKPDAKD